MRTLSALLATLLVALLASCSDDTVKTDGPKKSDGPKTDIGVTDGPTADKPKGDMTGVPSALQAVVNKFNLPKAACSTTTCEYGYDFDGTGKKNALGNIAAALKTLQIQDLDFQYDIDLSVNSGLFLMLIDLQAKSIVDDPAMKLQAFIGEDLDSPANAADNFSGSEPLAKQIGSPNDLILDGKITSNKLVAGPGKLVVPIPLTTTVNLTVESAHVEATLSSTPLSAVTQGVMNGVIPWTDIDKNLIPALAKMIDAYYKDTATPPATKTIMKTFFDPNGDGTITDTEFRNSALLTAILKPDVDTNKDGTNDALSMGMGFTAVKCTIKK